jgi:hypothetical protein
MTANRSRMIKPFTASLVLLLLGLAGGPAAAQQPSQAQVGAIRSACRADYQAHCSSVQPGGSAALACLQRNVAALSAGCQKAVGAVGGASAPTQKSGEAPSASPPSAATAPPPAAATSAPADTGATAAPAAVPPAAAASAPAARSAVATPPGRSAVPLPVELAILRRACGPDVQANCPGVRPGGGQVIACLAANQAALSPNCRRALASAR